MQDQALHVEISICPIIGTYEELLITRKMAFMESKCPERFRI